MKSESIQSCSINKTTGESSIVFHCGLKVHINNGMLSYESSHVKNTEENRLAMQAEVKKKYGNTIHFAVLYFCIKTEV